jgi:dipeptidyl aminopeptidase/acylaminoacyl peptidase
MRPINRWIVILTTVFFSYPSIADKPANTAKQTQNTRLTLEAIMADPDWMGNSPENPSWSLDGKRVYFEQKAEGRSHNESYQLDPVTKKAEKLTKDQQLAKASASAKFNPAESHGVFTFQNNLYLIEVATGKVSPVTADSQTQRSAVFTSDHIITYRQGYTVYQYDRNTGLSSQVADFRLEKDPEAEQKKSYLEQSQPRLLDYVKQQQDEKDFQEQREKELKLHQSKTWYLGKGLRIKTFRISPNGQWVILGTVKKDRSGKSDHMPEFVTEDGYVNDRKVRSLVGTSEPLNEAFYLFNLKKQTKLSLELNHLPGINDDPLKKLRKKAAQKIGYKYKDKKGDRAVYAYNWLPNQGVAWNDDSSKAAILLFSYDNKSRWILTLDTKETKLKTAHWMTEDTWVNDWTFNEFGWLPDNNTLYYLSEEEGYSHLYIKKGKRRATQLTDGQYEVSDLTVGKDGKHIYYRANQKHPGIYEIYRLNLDTRSSEALTDLNGVNHYKLSPDEQSLLITHSSTTRKPELFLHGIGSEKAPVQITQTMSEQFLKQQWQAPEIVAIKSSHIDRSIYSRLYKPKSVTESSAKKRPAVMFVHGAGYLQNSHQGWSGYFREYMFHNYLVEKGFVVLDMDYRASKGYGRDWRTAIYRNMGTPELQDLKDGAEWLVENMNVDPEKIGVYGGSYGGFMTFMAMFKEPELFASGAALRPVTDWAHYNHGYTSNILNTPQVDPDAYERSSPIEFADGLNKPLLICHGMVDDNVFFKDTVRLVQRLIELKKTKHFETAIYPVEPHGFKQPSSWLDEYTRIDQLFERTLR